MLADPEFWRRLRAELDDEIDSVTSGLADGKVPIELYRETVGYLRGLKKAVSLSEDIVKDMNEPRRDDDGDNRSIYE